MMEELQAALGRENVLFPGDDMEPYTHDETEDLRFQPDVVVRPRSAQEVSAVLRIADRERIPVTPRAAGTSLSGGALPVRGGIVLSVELWRLDTGQPHSLGLIGCTLETLVPLPVPVFRILKVFIKVLKAEWKVARAMGIAVARQLMKKFRVATRGVRDA